METYQIAAIVVAAVLGIDALIHAYWLTGRVWPASDVTALSRAVLGADVPFTPRVLVPLVLVLLAGAAAVLGRAGLIAGGIPEWIWAVGTIAVGAGLLVRGLAGAVWVVSRSRGSWFYRLNAAAYTPVCLLLCAATVVAFRR